jgi:Zn-dependent M28 family amino/carboxypeptidase
MVVGMEGPAEPFECVYRLTVYVFDRIRAVVNVDSCGTTGREILFQANSREMIDAYKQAPYPHGTVMVCLQYQFACMGSLDIF